MFLVSLLELFALRWKSTPMGRIQSEVWGAEGQRQGGTDVSQEDRESDTKPEGGEGSERRKLGDLKMGRAETHTQRDTQLSHTLAPRGSPGRSCTTKPYPQSSLRNSRQGLDL